MRNAETVLAIIQERGKRGLPLEDIYRQLYNPQLMYLAYQKLQRNDGALTPGVTGETVDGMSEEKISKIIEALRYERHRWSPAKRVYIPKKNGKKRPLGLPTWTDKLVQEVMRVILDAYYEPQFSQYSHGFRPNRGCGTALITVQHYWTGTKWFIEGDISKCFDNLDHQVLIDIMKRKLHDGRFMRLVETMIEAGYVEDWTYHTTLSGTPQGGVISPILSNIYLDQLDRYVEDVLLPAYNRGEERRRNPAHRRIAALLSTARTNGDMVRAHELIKQRRALPSKNPTDPDYRRLHYIRYADDFLLGFAGPKAEAEEIKTHLRDYLATTLHLELSQEKTLITHASTESARFLGYDVHTLHADDKIDRLERRSINGTVELKVPQDVIAKACTRHLREGKPIHRPELTHGSDYAIVRQYQDEYRGLVEYYRLASNVSSLSKVQGIMRTGLLKTLANKHTTSVSAMVRKYQTSKDTPHGTMSCLRVTVTRDGKTPLVAEFGGIPLRRERRTLYLPDLPRTTWSRRTDLLSRLLARTCELCGYVGPCEVHHIRKLADLRRPGKKELPNWTQKMIAMRRKQLVVCHRCHIDIHAGRPTGERPRPDAVTGEPDEAKVSSPVRRGADGKGAQQ